MMKSSPQPIFRKDYQTPDYLIDTVDLKFDLGEDVTVVKAALQGRAHHVGKPLVLDGEKLQLKSITLDGRSLTPDEYRVDEKSLTIVKVPEKFLLETVVEIKPQENTALEGLYKSGNIFCTQCEAHGFRRITYFLDRPDVMARFTVTITADAARYPILLSNGNATAQGKNPDDRHWVTWVDPFKKPCYLFALVAGDLEFIEDFFVTMSGRKVTLRIFVEKGNKDKCHHAMTSLKKAMKWDETTFGREYDLDIFMIVAVHDFNMGAMENKGLNIFNSKYILANPETATDTDYAGIESVIAHEYFHNWTGDRITCRDWFQLSLKEGLTVFRDQEFSADIQSRDVVRIQDVNTLRLRQFAEDEGPLAHPVRPDSYIEMNNFYTATVYEKGAEVIRMMQTLLGKQGFRKGMDLYFSRHDGQAVTCDDFVKAMEDANNVDFSQFRLWYSQAGTPKIAVHTQYDQTAHTYTVTLKQSCSPPQHIPFVMGLLDHAGRDIPLGSSTGLLELKKEEETFQFENIPQKPVPSFLRNFSAPVKLQSELSVSDLIFLLAHDTNNFNRWDASLQLDLKMILQLMEDYHKGRSFELIPEYVNAYQKVLNHPILDKALKAEILLLPSENYIGSHLAQVDVEAVYKSRHFIRQELAHQLKQDFQKHYTENARQSLYSYDQSAVGERAFKNVCLSYLMVNNDVTAQALCIGQYNQADNMTDRLAALRAISHSDTPARQKILNHFYETWQHEPLVVDKWFAIQAMSELPTVLEQVKQLMQRPAFNIKNPNKVRALIGAFSSSNFIGFHDKAGEGYRFLADQILSLDKINPQIASRLLEPLTQWRRYKKPWQELMHAALVRISKEPKLSNNVYEIVSKCLSEQEITTVNT